MGDLFPVLGIAINDARLPVLGAHSLFPVLGMAINDALLPVLGMAINDALLPVLGKASIAALLPVRGNGIIEALLPVLGKGINACRFDRVLDLLPNEGKGTSNEDGKFDRDGSDSSFSPDSFFIM